MCKYIHTHADYSWCCQWSCNSENGLPRPTHTPKHANTRTDTRTRARTHTHTYTHTHTHLYVYNYIKHIYINTYTCRLWLVAPVVGPLREWVAKAKAKVKDGKKLQERKKLQPLPQKLSKRLLANSKQQQRVVLLNPNLQGPNEEKLESHDDCETESHAHVT